MITLQKVGDALKFTFTDNPLYLQNGTIEVPVNSLTLVTDNSGIATFKKSASNDIFVCASYDELGMSKAELETWFKENAVGGVGIESGDVQTMINQSISGMADNASYDSVSQEIKFYNGNTEVYSVDASDFVIDGMIDDVRIETISGVTYLVIDFNTASGKQDIQIPLTDIFDPSNYYTKAEIDAFSGEVESAITEMSEVTARALVDLEDNKQDKLSAGTGINIDSANTISCTVTPPTYSAGRGISISNNTISTDLNVYSGQGVNSISLCNSSGTGNGESSIDGMASVGGGFKVTTKNYAETAFGTNNQSNGLSTSMTLSSGATLFSVGNGTGNTKHNAFEIRQNGDIYITSGNSDIKLQDNLGGVNVVQTTGTSTTDVMSQDTVTTQLNNKANKSAAVGGYRFGSTNNVVYIQYKSVSDSNIGNNIYYPKINGKGIFTNNSIYAQNNYDFQLVETSAITTSITSGSTDSEIPSAKAVYDQLGGLKLQQITQADYDALVSGGTVDNSTLYIITNVVN